MKTLEEIEAKRKSINDAMIDLRNQQFNIEMEYIQLIQNKCKENIGRCFKKTKNNKIISYCKIIDIDRPESQIHGHLTFNQYQYPAIWFNYPYNNSKTPFYEDDIFSGAWKKDNDISVNSNHVSYEEISKEEFFKKFEEVNKNWVTQINEF